MQEEEEASGPLCCEARHTLSALKEDVAGQSTERGGCPDANIRTHGGGGWYIAVDDTSGSP